MASVNYWLIKSEPSVYAFSQLKKDRRTDWTGVRNYEARNNLRAMQPGDLCLYYHSGEGKEVVGIARVKSAATEDPTAPGENWASVVMEPVADLVEPVTLATFKATPAFADFPLLIRSRISVVPSSAKHFQQVLKLGKTKL